VLRKFPKRPRPRGLFIFVESLCAVGSGVLSNNSFRLQEDTMFEQSMLSSAADSPWQERTRRGWTTLTSFGLQALAMGVLLVLPLLRPMGLPSFHQLSTPISIGQPLADAPAPRARAGSSFTITHPATFFFRRPSALPVDMHPSVDDAPPDVGNGPYIPGSPGRGDSRGISLFGSGTQPVLPAAPPPTATHPVHLSHMNEGSLVRKVQPVYPPLARSARIQGTVVLQAVISKQGMIENLTTVTGHPMLVQAAVDAVRQWRYRPYMLNGEPVEVETQITVNFSLAGN
jgi:protein TonB